MKIKAIITGSTGMVGKGVLLECLEHPEVESVLVINRQPLGLKHEKLKEIIHQDFFDLSAISNQLQGYNACFFCLGVSSTGMQEAEYRKLTYDLTMNVARTLVSINQGMTFCYISGAGTDSHESSRMMWARVKGKTENDLLALPFKASYMFRPGVILPRKGIRSRTKSYRIMYMIFWPLFPIFKLLPGIATDTVKLGKAMINSVIHGYQKTVLESADINILAVK